MYHLVIQSYWKISHKLGLCDHIEPNEARPIMDPRSQPNYVEAATCNLFIIYHEL